MQMQRSIFVTVLKIEKEKKVKSCSRIGGEGLFLKVQDQVNFYLFLCSDLSYNWQELATLLIHFGVSLRYENMGNFK